MKTKLLTNWKAVLVLAGLPFVAAAFLGQPQISKGDEVVADDPPVALPGEGAAIVSNQIVTVDSAGSTTALQPTPATLPDLKLSGGVKEVAKLAQSGVDEKVMLTYITDSSSRFSLGPDQIIYLNDLGVTGPVITAMMQHDAAIADLPAVSLPATAAVDDSTVVNTQPATQMVDTSVYPPETYVDYTTYDPGTVAVNDAGYFYDSLAPYGSWVYLNGYGLCWQPTVYVRNHDWRPYGDRGRWLYSDSGWYWQSDYSWGWAAFHYGRWFNDGNRGWVWQPNRVWGPAWVSWRQSKDVCGWAPLPPGAVFTWGVGLTFRGHSVAPNFGFGLSASHYTFIPVERLGDYSPGRYSFAGARAGRAFTETTVINHFGEANHRVFNRGVDPAHVESASHTPVRRAVVEEARREGDRRDLAERLERRGNSLVVSYPPLPEPPAHRGSMDRGNVANRGNSPTFTRNIGSPRTALDNPPAAATRTQPVLGAPTPATPSPTAATGQGSRINVHVRGDVSQVASSIAPAPATTPAVTGNVATGNSGRGANSRNSIVMVGNRNVLDTRENAPELDRSGTSFRGGSSSSSTGLMLPPRAGQPAQTIQSPRVGVTTSPANPPSSSAFHVTVREPLPVDPPVAYEPPNAGNRLGRPSSDSTGASQSFNRSTPATGSSAAINSGQDSTRSRSGNFNRSVENQFPQNNAVRSSSAPAQSQLMLPPSHSQTAPAQNFSPPATHQSASVMIPPSHSQSAPSSPPPAAPAPSHSSSSSSSSSSSPPPSSGRR